MARYDPRYVDAEERQLLADVKKTDPRLLKRPSKKEQNEFRRAAKAFIEKEAKMNIRIASPELEQIKARGANGRIEIPDSRQERSTQVRYRAVGGKDEKGSIDSFPATLFRERCQANKSLQLTP